MTRSIATLITLPLMIACGGTDFSTAEAAGGRRSTGSGGAQASEGGKTATTLPAVDCASLLKTYLAALELARACDPGKASDACKADWVLPGPCNCDVLVNAESAAYSTAKAHRDAFVQANCSVEACPTVDCASGAGMESPTCKSSGSGSASTCQW